MKAKVPEAIFKKAAVSSADAPPMLDMSAVQKAWQMDVLQLYFLCLETSTRLLTLSTRPSALSFTLDRVITLVALLPLLILRLKKCPQLEKLRCKPLS